MKRVVFCAVIAVLMLAAAPAAAQRQQLIAPGEQWPDLTQPNIGPGDEIVLMPGEHVAGALVNLRGTAEQPIVIRALDARNPVLIRGGYYGLRLSRCAHVVIKHVHITGATIAGVQMDDAVAESNGADVEAAHGESNFGHIMMRHVTVERTGPEGRRHGIAMVGQTAVRVEDCVVRGWGGAAVDVAASVDVQIEECVFEPLSDHSQAAGVLVRGGSKRVRVRGNTFGAGATYGVKVGDRLRVGDFRPRLGDDVERGCVFSGQDVRVEDNVFVSAGCAVALSHGKDCLVRNNTVVKPTLAAFSLALDHEDARFGGLMDNSIRGNLIVYEPGVLQQLVAVNRPLTRDHVAVDVNLWWSGETLDERAALGARRMIPVTGHSEQTWDIDPQLDGSHHAMAAEAGLFGMSD